MNISKNNFKSEKKYKNKFILNNSSPPNEEEQNSFKQWQKRKNNPYAFYNKEQKIIFIDGAGIQNTCSINEKRKAIKKISFILGIAMFIYLIGDFLLGNILPAFLYHMGIPVLYSFFSNKIYGQQNLVIITISIVEITRYLLPIIFIRKSFKLPIQAALPFKIPLKKTDFSGLVATMLLFFIVNWWIPFVDAESKLGTSINSIIYNPSGIHPFWQAFYFIFEFLIIPAMIAILFSGDMLKVLQQFGNGTAIFITSFIASIMTHNITQFLPSFILCSIASACVIKSNSIIPAIINHSIYRTFIFLLVISRDVSSILKISIFVFICLFSITIFILSLCQIKTNNFNKQIILKYLNLKNIINFIKEKIVYIFQNGILICVLMICFIIAIATYIW